MFSAKAFNLWLNLQIFNIIGVADPENSPSPIDGAVIVVTEQLTEV